MSAIAPAIQRDRAQSVHESCRRAVAPWGQQRQRGEQRNHRHVLEQQDGECALTIVLLKLAALVQDLQSDGGRRHGQRNTRHHGAAPVEQAGVIGEGADRERGQRQLGGAETEDGAAHGDEFAEFEFQPDQEQQQDDAELGDRNDAFRRAERRDPVWTDDDAGDQVGHDRGEAEPAGDRYAQDCGG